MLMLGILSDRMLFKHILLNSLKKKKKKAAPLLGLV